MSTEAVAVAKHDQFIVLGSGQTLADIPAVLSRLAMPGKVAISFRHVGGVDRAFLRGLLEALRDGGAVSVRPIFASPSEVALVAELAAAASLPLDS